MTRRSAALPTLLLTLLLPLAGAAFAAGPDEAGRGWKLLVNAFDGPAPYSQYFTLDVSWIGLGLEIDL